MAGAGWKLLGLSLVVIGSLTALGIIQLTFLIIPISTFGQVYCPIPFYVCLTTSITFGFISSAVGLGITFGGVALFWHGSTASRSVD